MKIIVKKCRLHGIIKSLNFTYSSFLYRLVLRFQIDRSVWNRRLICEIFHWIFHPFTGLICIGIFDKKEVL
ncbi:MAG: hypothetical protein K0Q87_2873 [Neobacillus sp.]|nr:hypothetical protein [Neobacillus sp.]